MPSRDWRRKIETPGFVVVCGLAFITVSVMLAFRLAAGGAPRRSIAIFLLRIWTAMAVSIVLLAAISTMLGPSGANGAGEELSDLFARVGRLSVKGKIVFGVGIVAAIKIFAYAISVVRKTMNKYHIE